MLLRSKKHWLLNPLLKPLLQEILTQAHQCPNHNHMIFTLMGIPFNRCPLEGIWTHLPYGAFIIPYNSLVSKYGNWHHLLCRWKYKARVVAIGFSSKEQHWCREIVHSERFYQIYQDVSRKCSKSNLNGISKECEIYISQWEAEWWCLCQLT